MRPLFAIAVTLLVVSQWSADRAGAEDTRLPKPRPAGVSERSGKAPAANGAPSTSMSPAPAREQPVVRGALESALAATRDEVFDTAR